jgi:uncharacterized protein (TIRG00374 family)
MKKGLISYFWRLLISLLLLLFLLRFVNQNEVNQLLSNLIWPYLIVYFGLALLDRLIMAYKWKILLEAKEIPCSFGKLIVVYFKGTFLGNLLPTSLGGDAIRAYELSKNTRDGEEVITSIIMERYLGFLSSALMALMAIPLLILFVPAFPRTIMVLLTLFLAGGLFFLFWLFRGKPHSSKISNLLGRLPWAEKIGKISTSFVLYRNHPRALGRFFIWSFGEQLLPIGATYLLSLSLGLPIPFHYLIPIIPITQFFARIPVSLSGLGIQEGLFVWTFTQIGISASSAFTLGLASNLGNILSSLPGAYFYFRGKSIPHEQ